MNELIKLGRGPAQDELEYYDATARSPERVAAIRRALTEVQSIGGTWACPLQQWLDNYFDVVAQAEVYEHLRPVVIGRSILQLGGTGKEALKALLGGARQAYLATPVAGEAELASELAAELGLSERFVAIVAPGESVPLSGGSVNAVISAGCLHHMDVAEALRESFRLLTPGGRFGAWDPWHARLYGVGTAVLGKREPGVECRPLNPQRLASLTATFPDGKLRLHSPFVRYGLLAAAKLRLCKAGTRPSLPTVQRWMIRDDKWCSRFPRIARNGSSAAVLASKP